MQKKNGLLKNQIVSLVVIVLVAVAVLLVYSNSQKPTQVSSGDLTTPVDMAAVDSSSCIACHTDEKTIASLAVVSDASDHAAEGGWGVAGPQLEAIDKFLVSAEFSDSTHGQLGCIACHGGENSLDIGEAHNGMNPYPSGDINGVCASCHSGVTDTFETSIHRNIQGMSNGLMAFTDFESLPDSPEHEEAFGKNCFACHASCGECHVSRPKGYSGGLINQHEFFKTPPMEDTCFGCHGARNAGEYMGTVGFSGDVHHEMGMDCMACHDIDNFHGAGGEVTAHMYEENLPSCLDCHEEFIKGAEATSVHTDHVETVSCQVCHAQANSNCFECHLDYNDDKTKLIGSSETKIMFRIGLNPEITEERPYKYVTLRHIPTSEKMLDQVGDNLLPNYHEISNWKYSPTHNIQKSTFQNESCDACHGNENIFLQEKDLIDSDSKDNWRLIPPIP